MLCTKILIGWQNRAPRGHQVTGIISKTHLRFSWSNESPRGHNTTGAWAALISIWLIRIIGKTEVLTMIVVGVNVELEFSCWDRVPNLVKFSKLIDWKSFFRKITNSKVLKPHLRYIYVKIAFFAQIFFRGIIFGFFFWNNAFWMWYQIIYIFFI